MIIEKTVYECEGRDFYTLEKAQDYNTLCNQVRDVMSMLKPRPDGNDYENGKGYVQQEQSVVDSAWQALIHIGRVRYNSPTLGRFAQRYADDSGDKCLSHAFWRLNCICKQNREFGQPYYALNPWAATLEEIAEVEADI